MTRDERACAYLEAMAEKAGGDVRIFTNASGKYMMQKRGDHLRSIQVSLEETRESFNAKVKRIMEG